LKSKRGWWQSSVDGGIQLGIGLLSIPLTWLANNEVADADEVKARGTEHAKKAVEFEFHL